MNNENEIQNIQKAVLDEYFKNNWISVLWKIGGAIVSLIVFGFWIGWWAKGITDSKEPIKIIEKHYIEEYYYKTKQDSLKTKNMEVKNEK